MSAIRPPSTPPLITPDEQRRRNAGATLALVQRSDNGDASKRKLPAVRLDGSLITDYRDALARQRPELAQQARRLP